MSQFSDLVTLATQQTITGVKHFTNSSNIFKAKDTLVGSLATTGVINTFNGNLSIKANQEININSTDLVIQNGNLTTTKSAVFTEELVLGLNPPFLINASTLSSSSGEVTFDGHVRYPPTPNPFGGAGISRSIPSSDNITGLSTHMELQRIHYDNYYSPNGTVFLNNPYGSFNTNISIMPSIYYGYTGDLAQTNDLEGTSKYIVAKVITSAITANSFSYYLKIDAPQFPIPWKKMNIDLLFLITYNLLNSNYPKSY